VDPADRGPAGAEQGLDWNRASVADSNIVPIIAKGCDSVFESRSVAALMVSLASSVARLQLVAGASLAALAPSPAPPLACGSVDSEP
jgi:hypothetical protein